MILLFAVHQEKPDRGVLKFHDSVGVYRPHIYAVPPGVPCTDEIHHIQKRCQGPRYAGQ